MNIGPFLDTPGWQIFTVLLAYAITLYGSGIVVPEILRRIDQSPKGEDSRVGAVIGKCENIIAITCVLADQITGLALIFAAKSLVRNTEKGGKDDYYLCGTLVNLVWSLLIGFAARLIVQGF